MTARIAPLALVVCLLAAAPAGAKGVDRVSVCGADGCAELQRDAKHRFAPFGDPAPPPAPGEPHFDLEVSFAHPGEPMRLRWLPTPGLLRNADGAWMRASMDTQRDLERVTADLTAHGARPAKPRGGEKEDGGGGASTAAIIGAPAGAALALGAVLLTRRRRRA